MAWTFYELRFRLLSPLHIGHQKIGNIQRTRRYVPARTLWGALTARLTRNARARAAAGIAEGNYVAMGDEVKKQIAFSYFFPAVEGQPLFLPCYRDGGLYYLCDELDEHGLSPETFAWRHLGSYASTALNYERNAAEEASLHEVEFIAPRARFHNASQPVELHGYAIVAESCQIPWPEVEAALREIQIGGERRYGWGRLRLDQSEKRGEGEAILFGKLRCEAKNEARPKVLTENNAALLAHSAVNKQLKVCGEIEPLVSRVWEQSKGPGQNVEFTEVCYVPGSVITSEGGHWFSMTSNHTWEAIAAS